MRLLSVPKGYSNDPFIITLIYIYSKEQQEASATELKTVMAEASRYSADLTRTRADLSALQKLTSAEDEHRPRIQALETEVCMYVYTYILSFSFSRYFGLYVCGVYVCMYACGVYICIYRVDSFEGRWSYYEGNVNNRYIYIYIYISRSMHICSRVYTRMDPQAPL